MARTFLIIILLSPVCLFGQMNTNFISSGKIEFERKTNTHRLFFSDEQDSWTDLMKKQVPQFSVAYFDLFFTEKESLYQPGREDASSLKPGGFWRNPPSSSNVVYKNYEQEIFSSQKQVFEKLFLVQDSLNKYEWKIQPETRTIAGFECRKALTTICDSVVVVAFYTEEIIPSNGPESFNGLPGMILGLAVPRLYTTWFATKVELADAGLVKKIVAPSKGRKTDLGSVISTMDEALKDWWGKSRERYIWFTAL